MKSIYLSQMCKATAATALVMLFSGHAAAQSQVLTNNAGMTVYTFDKDTPGKSACYGDCAAAWPPVAATSMPAGADFGVISREDGGKQAAYKGKPLYFFAGDRRVGDTNGDNVQNVWHVVPAGGQSRASGSGRTASASGSSY
jgi:predicted lipoprotein with Yx(FWY)xxD motif